MGVHATEEYYWMLVTLDDYELPLAVAETREELAEMIGVKPKSITEQLSRKKRKGKKCQYARIEREEIKLYE